MYKNPKHVEKKFLFCSYARCARGGKKKKNEQELAEAAMAQKGWLAGPGASF
jgi:hypothetical protein